MTLTTDKASRTSFTLTRLKKGYSTEEVDAFMQEITAALRSWETGTADGGSSGYDDQAVGISYGILTSRDVTGKTFSSTRLHDSYEPDEVDALMQEAATTLLAWETGTAVGAPQPAAPRSDGDEPRPAAVPQEMLTAQNVMDAKFQPGSKFGEGYEQDEVDELLDDVAQTLRAWEASAADGAPRLDGAPPGALTSEAVASTSTKLRVTRFRNSYERDPVDELLNRVVETLRALETGTAISAATAAPRPAGGPAGALTSHDVLNTKFQVTRFEGYEQRQVDEFLDDVAQTLRAWEASAADGAPRLDGAPPGALTSEAVADKKFQVTRFREGYEQDEVDELLDTLMHVLRDYEARSGH